MSRSLSRTILPSKLPSRAQRVQPVSSRSIEFEDHGQDFLRFDLNAANVVVGCTPFQASVWCEAVVLNPDVGVGEHVRITTKRGITLKLRYPVSAISAGAAH